MLTKLWAALIRFLYSSDVRRMLGDGHASQIGYMALDSARREIGNGEFGGNNRGPDVDRYRGDLGGKGPWCAAFAFWAILDACRRLGRACPIKRTHGARRLYGEVVKAGHAVDLQSLEPGDIVLWSRGTKGWQGHVGIVSGVMRNRAGRVTGWRYIAGNEGPYPAKVGEFPGKSKRLVGFARLPR